MTQQIIPALTVYQPWANLIRGGHKRYETRHWKTNYRGLLAIHAGKRWTEEERLVRDTIWVNHGIFNREIAASLDMSQMAFGAVLCICKLVRIEGTTLLGHCISQLECDVGDWRYGRYAWELEVVRVFDEPIPARGQQGMWQWTMPEGVTP